MKRNIVLFLKPAELDLLISIVGEYESVETRVNMLAFDLYAKMSKLRDKQKVKKHA